MFCSNCGKEIDSTTKFCPHCGLPSTPSDSSADALDELTAAINAAANGEKPKHTEDDTYANTSYTNVNTNTSTNQQTYTPTQHAEPRCTCCGAVGKIKVVGGGKKLLYKRDIFIALLLLLFWGIGLIYLGVVVLLRLFSRSSQEQVCKKCGARNMFTYNY